LKDAIPRIQIAKKRNDYTYTLFATLHKLQCEHDERVYSE